MGVSKSLYWALLFFSAISAAWPHNNVPTRRQDNYNNTVSFEVTATWEDYSPNGLTRKAILINGQLIGPTLHAQVGDNVQFKFTNAMPFNTTVHFHGITQLGTPWSDGVPGLSQRPIPPGDSFLYNFTVDEYGTYFYHAHDQSQIMDGLIGPILIQPAPDTPSPFPSISSSPEDVQAMDTAMRNANPLVITDWAHYTASELEDLETRSGLDLVCDDSILLNGKGSRYCLSRQEIDDLTPAAGKALLGPLGLGLTNTGCLPLAVESILLAASSPNLNSTLDFSAIPPEYEDQCISGVGAEEVIRVDSNDLWASINIIGAQSIQSLTISIDEHPMYIYAADGRYIEPQKVDAIPLLGGVRYSAMIKLDKPVGDYMIRAASNSIAQLVSGFAKLSYVGSTGNNTSTPSIAYNALNTTADFILLNETTIVPFPPETIPAEADVTYFLRVRHPGDPPAIGQWTFSSNGQATFNQSLEHVEPFLFNPYSSTAQNPNTSIITKMNQWVDIVIILDDSTQPPHPIHKHSNKFYVVGAGNGQFNYSTVAEAAQAMPDSFNLKTPQIRDTFPTPPSATGNPAWLAIRYHVVNPGAFLLHCHIQPHLAGGFAIALLDGIDSWPQVPDVYLNGNGGC